VDDAVRHVLEFGDEFVELGGALGDEALKFGLEGFAFGDVDLGAQDADGLAGRVADNLAARGDPAFSALAKDAIFPFGGFAAGSEPVSNELLEGGEVIGMNARNPGVVAALKRVQGQAEDLFQLGSPDHGVGGEVPVENADAAGLLGQQEALLAVAEGLLGLAFGGDIVEDDDDAEDFAGGVEDRGGAILDGDVAAVAGNEVSVVGQAEDAEDAGHDVVSRAAGGFVNDVEDAGDGLSAGFVHAPAGEIGGNGVHEGDAELAIAGDDSVADTGEGDAEPFALEAEFLFGAFALAHLGEEGIVAAGELCGTFLDTEFEFVVGFAQGGFGGLLGGKVGDDQGEPLEVFPLERTEGYVDRNWGLGSGVGGAGLEIGFFADAEKAAKAWLVCGGKGAEPRRADDLLQGSPEQVGEAGVGVEDCSIQGKEQGAFVHFLNEKAIGGFSAL
jgi:hypothetical protein